MTIIITNGRLDHDFRKPTLSNLMTLTLGERRESRAPKRLVPRAEDKMGRRYARTTIERKVSLNIDNETKAGGKLE